MLRSSIPTGTASATPDGASGSERTKMKNEEAPSPINNVRRPEVVAVRDELSSKLQRQETLIEQSREAMRREMALFDARVAEAVELRRRLAAIERQSAEGGDADDGGPRREPPSASRDRDDISAKKRRKDAVAVKSARKSAPAPAVSSLIKLAAGNATLPTVGREKQLELVGIDGALNGGGSKFAELEPDAGALAEGGGAAESTESETGVGLVLEEATAAKSDRQDADEEILKASSSAIRKRLPHEEHLRGLYAAGIDLDEYSDKAVGGKKGANLGVDVQMLQLRQTCFENDTRRRFAAAQYSIAEMRNYCGKQFEAINNNIEGLFARERTQQNNDILRRGITNLGQQDPLEEAAKSAELSKNPKSLQMLWLEYKVGLNGRKPARKFTRSEKNASRKVSQKYSRRNKVWQCIQRLVNAGFSAEAAIQKIHQVYGNTSGPTKIINQMIADKRKYGDQGGFHPDLQVPASDEKKRKREQGKSKSKRTKNK